jgi:hypothetical protein
LVDTPDLATTITGGCEINGAHLDYRDFGPAEVHRACYLAMLDEINPLPNDRKRSEYRIRRAVWFGESIEITYATIAGL